MAESPLARCLKCGSPLPPVGDCPSCAAREKAGAAPSSGVLDKDLNLDRRKERPTTPSVPSFDQLTKPPPRAAPPPPPASGYKPPVSAVPPGMMPKQAKAPAPDASTAETQAVPPLRAPEPATEKLAPMGQRPAAARPASVSPALGPLPPGAPTTPAPALKERITDPAMEFAPTAIAPAALPGSIDDHARSAAPARPAPPPAAKPPAAAQPPAPRAAAPRVAPPPASPPPAAAAPAPRVAAPPASPPPAAAAPAPSKRKVTGEDELIAQHLAPSATAGPVRSAAAKQQVVHAVPAPLWRRLLAFVIDTALVLGVAALFLVVAAAVAGTKAPETQLRGFDWLIANARAFSTVLIPTAGLAVVLALLYSTAFAFLWNGRTLGRRLLGIQLVDQSGLPPTPLRAAARAALALVSFAIFLGGFWLALFDRRGQTLHDKLTGTFVVQRK